MQLPKWFKVAWWAALSAVVTAYLIARFPDLIAGRGTPADIVVFLVWVVLLVLPIFQEVELFGLQLKQNVQKLEEELKTDIHSVRAELRHAVDGRTAFNPQILVPAPPPDSQLPDLERRVTAAVAEALAAHGVRQPEPVLDDLAVPDDISILFATRYGIERELRRLARDRQLDVGLRGVGVVQLSRTLVQAGVIDLPLDHAIREVYWVSFAGVHAEDFTAAQVGFVRKAGPQLIAALRAIRGTTA
jgi:hypothetical protein